jgi:hypothetical protein
MHFHGSVVIQSIMIINDSFLFVSTVIETIKSERGSAVIETIKSERDSAVIETMKSKRSSTVIEAMTNNELKKSQMIFSCISC